MKKTWMFLSSVLLAGVVIFSLWSCGQKKSETSAVAPAIDMSELLALNEAQGVVYSDSVAPNESLFHPDSAVAHPMLMPQYREHQDSCLANAETWYNAMLLVGNSLSAFEVWSRMMDNLDLEERATKAKIPAKEIASEIRNLSLEGIDPAVQKDVQLCRDSLAWAVENGQDDWELVGRVIDRFGLKMNETYPMMAQQRDKLIWDTLSVVREEMMNLSAQDYAKIAHLDDKKRLHEFLKMLQNCDTFDQQCSLFLNWNQNNESLGNEWSIAIAERLMLSGQYSPALEQIWLGWRAMVQMAYYGLSRDSEIPNLSYNLLRAKCLDTTLKWWSEHPSDNKAKASAQMLMCYQPLLRYGTSPYGNDAIVELDRHVKKITSDDEEE